MDLTLLIDEILIRGKEKFDDLEVFILKGKSIDIKVFQGQVDKYNIAETGGLSLRGIKDGKMGYSYTEKLDESSIDMLIDEALENSKYIDMADGDEIYSGSRDYRALDNFYEALSLSTMAERLTFTKRMEKEAMSLDERIKSVQACSYQEFQQERYIFNTKGLRLKDRVNGGFAYISVVAREGGDTKTGMGFRTFSGLTEVSPLEIAKEAVEEAISMLGAGSIKAGNYSILIKNTSFADLLNAFSSIFSGDNAQKGLSLLKDKTGSKVGAEILTIVDDPFMVKGYASRAFDDEGCKTFVKKIVDKGVLTTLLHTWKTARKEGLVSTGNGYRPSYKSTLGISPSNFYVENGSESLKDMMTEMGEGIYITDFQGLHSGLNPVSGDFSLSCQGYEIEEGKIKRPINQITVAGNFLHLLNDILRIGNDLSFSMPDSGYFGSPSVLIKRLSISGE